MSKLSWQVQINQRLRSSIEYALRRAAIVGVGNELHGDDAAGILVVRALRHVSHPELLVMEGGLAPENLTGPLRRFAPDVVVFIDAAQMGHAPGSIHWVAWEQLDGISGSTHTLPLTLVARYLHGELGCEVLLLGIEPVTLGPGASLSNAVADAVEQISTTLCNLYR